MVFSSIIFLFFFLPICLTIYFISPKPTQNFILLILSIIFYAWGEIEYTVIILISIMMNYAWGLLIANYKSRQVEGLIVFLAVVSNLSLLIYFKYIAFFIQDIIHPISKIFNIEGVNVTSLDLDSIHLPLGISFFTFQAISYVIDVHRESTPAQRNPIKLGLYIALFPQLIAGPIVRYHDIAAQLTYRKITSEKLSYGIQRFIIGLAKKAIIANSMGLVADEIFALNTNDLGTELAWLGIICYALQIFFDFSGYSDMAIGLGAIFGFTIPENFNYPYIATSIREFWRRWHITLSQWFRDYLYIPLGGSRVNPVRTYINLYIVFFLTGLWHGASWNFVIWGLIHGTFMVFERLGLEQWLKRQFLIFQHLYVLLVILIGWVFFRAETLPQALAFVERMFIYQASSDEYNIQLFLNPRETLVLFAGIIFSIPLIKIFDFLQQKVSTDKTIISASTYSLRLIALVGLFSFSVMSLISGSYNPFIYFRF